MNILFVTWDGPQVSYLEGLFLPIFERLASFGLRFDVLQFGWGPERQARTIAALCAGAGLGYRRVKVRRGLDGLAPMATAIAGGWHVRRAVRAFGRDVLMPRSHMPAIAVASAGGSRLRPILFDSDGLAADEKVESGQLSPAGPTYRILRRAEARAVRDSVSVLVRSADAARILAERSGVGPDRFHVVANGRDETLFQPFDEASRAAVREELGIAAGAPLLVYVGSIGAKYRFDRVRDFASALARLRPDARLLVLSHSPGLAKEALGDQSALDPVFLSRPPHQVGRYLAAGDLGLAFLAETRSARAVSLVKLGEYLLCGVPVLGSAVVASEAALREGLFFDESAGPDSAARWLVDKVLPARDLYRARARGIGLEYFSLERSVEDYRSAIAPLVSGRS